MDVHLFLFHFFVPTVARLQAEQEDVAKIQTQDEALLKKEDVVPLRSLLEWLSIVGPCIALFIFSFTVLKLTRKRRLRAGINPSSRSKILVSQILTESCSNNCLEHFPGMCPFDSQAKYCNNVDISPPLEMLIATTLIKPAMT